MGLFRRVRQLVDIALETDSPSQSPVPVEPLPGGWTAEQVASLEATPPDRKGLRPGCAVKASSSESTSPPSAVSSIADARGAPVS
jgi:hypothetical protein